MIEIIPAIMPYSYDDLVKKCQLASTVSKWAQIDVMDGIYVPSKSWPYDTELKEEFHHIRTSESSLPESATLSFIADLMVSNPEEVACEWIELGAEQIIFHIETLSDKTNHDFIIDFKNKTGKGIGIAIGTTTPAEMLIPFLDHVDFVQCMGIEKVGYQGQNFDERVIDQIKFVREKNAYIPIMVDGSVNSTTVKQLADVGATRLVVGSAIFGASDFKKSFDELTQIVSLV